VRDADGVVKQWEAIKRDEKNNRAQNYLADIPATLPALMRAQKAQKKVARVNFDWAKISDVITKVEEEVAETKNAIASGDSRAIADEIGDLLFAVVNLARKSNLDAETQLQSATDKFISRFSEVERRLRERGKNLGESGLEELDEIWDEVKRAAKPQ
jgi:MazG family protein